MTKKRNIRSRQQIRNGFEGPKSARLGTATGRVAVISGKIDKPFC
jgi:hypothetical protein